MTVQSWHVPGLVTYDLAPPNEILHVIFMQRQSVASRERVIDSLTNVDKEWALQYDPNARTRNLKDIPWIRDTRLSFGVILYITASEPAYKSFVLVDSGREDSTVIAAHWVNDEHSKPHLHAVRVQIGVANVLLTLLDDGKITSFEEVLGEADYEKTKVDFYNDQRPSVGEKPKAQPYEPPSFLPKDLALNKETIEIVALRELTDEQIDTLQKTIQGGGTKRTTRTSAKTEDVQIYEWQGKGPSRLEMRQIYDWMLGNTPEEDRKSAAFFIDNVLVDENDGPRVVAVSTDEYQDYHPVRMFTLYTNRVLPSLKAMSDSKHHNDSENGMIWKQEILPPTDQPLEFPGGSYMGCPVFYLTPFTLDQERTIRAALSTLSSVEEGADWGNIFSYHGYLFRSSVATHTLQDLVDLFQKSDPHSPTFDPDHSTLRFSEYPSHFVACDARVLDPDKPTVLMASCLGFSNHPVSDNRLGWLIGTMGASEAHITFLNLDIANLGPTECFEDYAPLWLNDLTAHEREAEQRRAAQLEEGVDFPAEREEWVGMDTVCW